MKSKDEIFLKENILEGNLIHVKFTEWFYTYQNNSCVESLSIDDINDFITWLSFSMNTAMSKKVDKSCYFSTIIPNNDQIKIITHIFLAIKPIEDNKSLLYINTSSLLKQTSSVQVFNNFYASFHIIYWIAFIILFSLGSDQYSKRKVLNFSFYKVFFLTMFFLFLNYFFNLYLNNITLFIITLSTVFLLFFNINKKSLKYISISLIVFLYCINLIYQYSLYKLIHMGDFLLIDLNLNTLEYNFKHFFSIYNKNENIVSIHFDFDDYSGVVLNSAIYKRIYLFLYTLNFFVFLFWIYVFFMVCKKHQISIK